MLRFSDNNSSIDRLLLALDNVFGFGAYDEQANQTQLLDQSQLLEDNEQGSPVRAAAALAAHPDDLIRFFSTTNEISYTPYAHACPP